MTAKAPSNPDAAFRDAIFAGKMKSCVALLKAGADPDMDLYAGVQAFDWQRGRTPLMEAVSRGAIPLAKALLAAGAAPFALDGRGDTALHAAMRSSDYGVGPADRLACVKLLVEAQAPEPFFRGRSLGAPLRMAIQWHGGEPEIADAIIEGWAAVARADPQRLAPLFLASLLEQAPEWIAGPAPALLEAAALCAGAGPAGAAMASACASRLPPGAPERRAIEALLEEREIDDVCPRGRKALSSKL